MLHRHCLIVTLVAAFSCSTQAAIIHVDVANCPGPGSGTVGDPYCSIQTAIDNAVDTDEIIVAEGTYFEAINFIGKAITVRSTDPNDPTAVANTVIDGTGNFHVVQCVTSEGSDTILDGFTITGGNANGLDFQDSVGGGMFNLFSNPTVTNCTISGNAAIVGGGMWSRNDNSQTVTNCTFSGNTASFNGGGMVNGDGSWTVTDCTFTGNTAAANDGGGMLNINGSPTVVNCTFTGNTAANDGGGMANSNSSPTVANCTFSGNSAAVDGGGMRNSSGSNSTVTDCTFSRNSAGNDGGGIINVLSSPTVTNCTFASNTAGNYGGGIRNSNSNPTLTGCIFTENSAVIRGGGMSNDGAFSTVTNCTFSGNTASFGGGMFNNDSILTVTVTNCTFSGNSANFGGGMINSASSLTVTNCTFSGNTAVIDGGGMRHGSFSSLTVTNCILWGDSPNEISGPATVVAYSDVQGGFPGTGNIDADPLFVDPFNGNYRLSPGSPCIDAGDNTAVPKGTTTDLDGNPRFVDDPNTPDCPQAPGTCGDPPVVDMGAYEVQGAPPCPWDCDGGESIDGTVGIVDFLALLAQWGGPGSCDFDGDGNVGILDFLQLLANWGPCP